MVRIDYMLQDNIYYAYIIYEEEIEEKTNKKKYLN
jgi:hypothetical protein